MNERPIQRWTRSTEYYDVATGEQITKYIANRDYIVIETHKKTTLNDLKTSGHIKYTKICQIQPQLKLEL